VFLIRRLVWFASGATAGFGGAMWIRRRLLRGFRRYVPERVSAEMTASARRLGTGVRDAIEEGRRAARQREAELRRELRPGAGPRPRRRPHRRWVPARRSPLLHAASTANSHRGAPTRRQ
jgi:predicted nucleic acid-binding protein